MDSRANGANDHSTTGCFVARIDSTIKRYNHYLSSDVLENLSLNCSVFDASFGRTYITVRFDVTKERKASEETQFILKALGLGVWRFHTESRHIDYDEARGELFGMPPQQIDSGLQIPHQIEQKLFQPFFTTKPIGQGTGLGLSIVKGILDTHGATITLNREFPNTCFEIRFRKLEDSRKTA